MLDETCVCVYVVRVFIKICCCMRKCIFRVTNIVEVTYNATTLTERIPLVDRVNDSFPSGFVFCIWLLLLLLVTRRPNSMETMEDIAFGDWPGQPMDLAGSNPWLPAYGYQPPTTLLEKEDFLGHPGTKSVVI